MRNGSQRHFLEMHIERNDHLVEISINQSQYIRSLLNRHGFENCRSIFLPLYASFQIYCNEDDCERVDPTTYQGLIGELIYIPFFFQQTRYITLNI